MSIVNGEIIRNIFGILIIGILAIVAMSEGLDGEIMKLAIGAIVVLALGEGALEYYFKKKNGS